MVPARYETFPHGALVGVRGRGPSVAAAFEQAGRALTSVLTDPEGVRPRDVTVIECAAPDPELLLVDWLNELIWEMAARRILFGRFEVAIEGGRLRARVWGEAVDRDRHAPMVEPKGATLAELRVSPEGDEWLAQCVVDV